MKFFQVRDTDERGCGHQHATAEKAANCARNSLMQHPLEKSRDVVSVVIAGDGKDDRPHFSTERTILQPRSI